MHPRRSHLTLNETSSSRTFSYVLRDVVGQQHFGGHAGNHRPIGIVDLQLQADGLDVALAAADVALRRVIALHGLDDDCSVDWLARGQTNFQLVANGYKP